MPHTGFFSYFVNRKLKKTLTIILLLGASAVMQAQAPDFTGDTAAVRKCWPMRLLDNVLDFRDHIVKNDTSYIARIPQKLKLGFAVNCSGADIDSRGRVERGNIRARLSTSMKTTISANIAYRGLGIGIKMDPANAFTRKSSTELNMAFYGNRIGIDAVYQASGVYKGNIEVNGDKSYIPEGVVNMDMLLVNTYYAFNARRFSYPAAFSYSWTQRRSGGSILAGLSYSLGRLSARADEGIGNPSMALNTSYGSIGVGYGYNFVIRQHWLMHLSAIPQLVVYSHNRLRIGQNIGRAPYRFPDVMIIGRLSLVRQFPKYYVGLSGKVTTSTLGDRSRLLLNNTKWIGQVSFGIKF